MLPRYYLVDEINENSNKHNLQLSNVHFREIYVYEFIYFFYVYGEGRESNPIWTRVTKSDAFNCLAEPFFFRSSSRTVRFYPAAFGFLLLLKLCIVYNFSYSSAEVIF